MFKKLFTCSLVTLLFLLAYSIKTVESQEDYSYVLGVWEGQWGLNGQKWSVTVKEIFPSESKDILSVDYQAFNMPGKYVPAGSYEVNNAVYKPGETYVISYPAKEGREYFFEFKKMEPVPVNW
jgi:hypothetical protein